MEILGPRPLSLVSTGQWDHNTPPVVRHVGMVTTWNMTLVQQWLDEMDTHDGITYCIIKTLEARNPSQLIVAFSTPICHATTVEQDNIGWQNFVEGKLLMRWKLLQEQHYACTGSSRMADQWAKGLITKLLEMVHDVWKYRNSVLHECDEHGLQKQSAAELEAAISMECVLGTTNVAQWDHHKYVKATKMLTPSPPVTSKHG